MARLILLNGPCSAGKTSTAKQLQNLLSEPTIHLGIDTFHLAIPPNKLELGNPDPDYLYPKQYEENGEVLTEIVHGPIVQAINAARYEAVVCFLQHGISVVADEIFWRQADVDLFIEKLRGQNVILVGMYVSEEEGERRAGLRQLASENYESDFRPQGMSLASNRLTHRFTGYDITIDTDNLTPADCAQEIYQQLPQVHAQAFLQLCGNYKNR